MPAFLGTPRAGRLSAGRTGRRSSTGRPSSWPGSCRGKYPEIFDDPTVGSKPGKLFDDAQRIAGARSSSEQAADGPRRLWLLAGRVDRRRHRRLFADERGRREIARFHTLRQQWERKGQTAFHALADFIAPLDSGRHGLSGRVRRDGRASAPTNWSPDFEAEHDDYNAIMAKALADRLAEAFAEAAAQAGPRTTGATAARRNCRSDELIEEKYRGIRPAPGYPACPDHTEKRTLFDLLGRRTGDRHHADRELRHVAGGQRSAGCTLPIPRRVISPSTALRATRSKTTPGARGCAGRSRALAGAESGLRAAGLKQRKRRCPARPTHRLRRRGFQGFSEGGSFSAGLVDEAGGQWRKGRGGSSCSG